MTTCLIVFGLVALGPAFAPTEDAEAILKDTLKLMSEMADLLKPVKDRASAEGALAKLKAINEQLAALKKKDFAIFPAKRRQLFAKCKVPIETTMKALGSEVARIHKLPEAKDVLTRELSRFDETSKTLVMMKEAMRSAARVQIKRIDKALQIYKLKTGKFPANLAALTEGKNPILKENDLHDPWEKHYLYDPTGPRNDGRRPDVWTMPPEEETIGNWEKDP